jgi:hypothetical protein
MLSAPLEMTISEAAIVLFFQHLSLMSAHLTLDASWSQDGSGFVIFVPASSREVVHRL